MQWQRLKKYGFVIKNIFNFSEKVNILYNNKHVEIKYMIKKYEGTTCQGETIASVVLWENKMYTKEIIKPKYIPSKNHIYFFLYSLTSISNLDVSKLEIFFLYNKKMESNGINNIKEIVQLNNPIV